MRSIRVRPFFLAVVVVAALVNSSGGVFAASCLLCGSLYYHCTKNCAAAYPTPPGSWRCMATCSERRQSCNTSCVCPSGKNKICGGTAGGAWTCKCV